MRDSSGRVHENEKIKRNLYIYDTNDEYLIVTFINLLTQIHHVNIENILRCAYYGPRRSRAAQPWHRTGSVAPFKEVILCCQMSPVILLPDFALIQMTSMVTKN